MPICDNCHAPVPQLGAFSGGKMVCCADCVFHPLGCRCRFGELGAAETFVYFDPDDPDEDDYVGIDSDEHENMMQCDCGAWNDDDDRFCYECHLSLD